MGTWRELSRFDNVPEPSLRRPRRDTEAGTQLLRGSQRMGKIFRRAAALTAGLAVAVSSTMGTGVAANADTGTTTACSVSYSKYSSIKAGSTGGQATAMEC